MTFRIGPLYVHPLSGRSVISHGITGDSPFLARFAAPQLIPLVIGLAVAVHVLHDPHHTRLRAGVERIPLNGKIVAAFHSGDTVIEPDDQITAESPERNITPRLQPPGCISYGIFMSTLVARISGFGLFADQLPGSGQKFVNRILETTAGRTRRASALLLVRKGVDDDLGRQRDNPSDDVSRKTLGSIAAFGHIDPNGIVARPVGCKLKHGTRFGYDRFPINRPGELRIGDISQRRRKIDRTADERTPIGRLTVMRELFEADLRRHLLHDLHDKFFDGSSVVVRCLDTDRVAPHRLFPEGIAHLRRNDLAGTEPPAAEVLLVRMLNIGSEGIFDTRQNLEPLGRQCERNDGRSKLQHIHPQLRFGFSGSRFDTESDIHFPQFGKDGRIGRFGTCQLAIDDP